jgi:hypothetical protein
MQQCTTLVLLTSLVCVNISSLSTWHFRKSLKYFFSTKEHHRACTAIMYRIALKVYYFCILPRERCEMSYRRNKTKLCSSKVSHTLELLKNWKVFILE